MAFVLSLFLPLTAALVFFSPTTVAQSEETEQVTWATVSFIYHGEKTPALSYDTNYDLTPLGAQQLYSAGSLLREAYVSPPVNGSQLATAAVINGLSANTIDNSQLYVLAPDDSYIMASAMAFMQGLYPPGNFDSAENQLQNGSWMSAPLGGYQYPNIASASALDFNFIWPAGNMECSQWSIAEVEQLSTPSTLQQYQDSLTFYESLTQPMFGAMDPTTVNFDNAYQLYEYALYEYTHNTTFQEPSLLSVSDMQTLYNLASAQQWTYLTDQGNSTIQSIAGRTLASKVLAQFDHNIASEGVVDKMTLLFGTYEPMVSFFALSSLSTSPSGSRFTSLPLHGSILTFELFSYTTPAALANDSVPYPATTDLYVRFLFRNGTDDNSALVSYPLFHRGNSETDMSWADFVNGMGSFSLDDVADWCSACQTATLFCEAIEDDLTSNPSSSSGSSSSRLAPAVAGVIGAAVTIAVLLLLAAILMLLGFRVSYVPRQDRKDELGTVAVAGAGGFKGREKLASDTDLTLKGGAGIRHERVGSWELSDGKKSGGVGLRGGEGEDGTRSLDKEIESGSTRIRSTADYGRTSEDGVPFGLTFGEAVKPTETV